MARVVHFEIHASDPERAVKFYEDVFGWDIKKWEGGENYWLVITGSKDEPGINGGIMKREGDIGVGDPTAYVCTIDVSSIDEYSSDVVENGGTIVMPKMEVPGAGWLVYCKDTEGNIFGMIESTMEM